MFQRKMPLIMTIAITIAVAVGVPMISYLGYMTHERLKWDRNHDHERDCLGYTTTTTTAPTTTTTTPGPTTTPPPKYRRRRGPRRTRTKWMLVPLMLAAMAATRPTIENWDRLTEGSHYLRQCGWGTIVLPILTATYLMVVMATNLYRHRHQHA